jgi:predicted metal-dependent hydrolase
MQEEVSYILTKARRKNISLSVNKRGQVEVKSPFFVSKKMIDDFVLSKKDWIKNAQHRISYLNKTPKAETAQDLAKQKILAKRLIIERIAHYNPDERFRFKKVTIKNMSSRWGSCSYEGNLNFNYRLIYLEPELLDYVVVHELCHLIEHNHSARFWLEVKKIIPDYKARERKIKKHLLC